MNMKRCIFLIGFITFSLSFYNIANSVVLEDSEDKSNQLIKSEGIALEENIPQ